MAKPIGEHEGNKYLRHILSATDNCCMIQVDVYAVLKAFNVTCPARQQAIKKLLCAGIRGKGGELEDLLGADAALSRAIELQFAEEKPHNKPSSELAASVRKYCQERLNKPKVAVAQGDNGVVSLPAKCKVPEELIGVTRPASGDVVQPVPRQEVG